MNWSFSCLLFVVALVGCSKGSSLDTPSGNSVPEIIVGMESRGEIPVLDRSTSLGGVDADKNGIRDDIDRLIAAQHKGVDETKALQQLARALQYRLTAGISTREAKKRESVHLERAMNCMSMRFGEHMDEMDRLFDLLSKSSVNTRARKLEEDRLDALASGTVIESSYEKNTCVD